MTLKGKEDDYGYDENVVTVMEAVNMAWSPQRFVITRKDVQDHLLR
jgi:hypothetical protein